MTEKARTILDMMTPGGSVERRLTRIEVVVVVLLLQSVGPEFANVLSSLAMAAVEQ